jgi:hypothetical protein
VAKRAGIARMGRLLAHVQSWTSWCRRVVAADQLLPAKDCGSAAAPFLEGYLFAVSLDLEPGCIANNVSEPNSLTIRPFYQIPLTSSTVSTDVADK